MIYDKRKKKEPPAHRVSLAQGITIERKKERGNTIMAYRKATLRKMDTNTRKLARLINDLDSALTRLKNFMPTVERMELESNALYSRLSTYEKKVFDREQLVTQPIAEPVAEPVAEPASLFPLESEQVQNVTLADLGTEAGA